MAMKEHPFLVTTTFQGDGVTIKYDITKPGRSDAVGKAYKFNADGKGELVGDGEAFDGKVIEVESDHKFTGAYMFGGLRLPIGESATVARGDKLVGALGPESAKGYVKAVTDPSALAALEATDINDDAKKLAAYNAARTEITNLVGATEGAGQVIEFDATDALVVFPG